MKTSVAGVILCAVLCAACVPSEEDLRRMVREEMNAAAEKTTIAPVGVIGPYSPAVRVGRFLFVSGQIALDPETGTLRSENIEVETRQVLKNLGRILDAAGAVFIKDVTTELRSRYAVAATATFALAALAVVSFAVGPFGGRPELLAAFLWTVILFAAAAGLAQAFTYEIGPRIKERGPKFKKDGARGAMTRQTRRPAPRAFFVITGCLSISP